MMTMRATVPKSTSSLPLTHPTSSIVAAPPRMLPPTSKPLSFPRRRSRPTSTTAAAALSADVAALIAFSALPFLGVQALADSEAGKKLEEDLKKRKPALLKIAAEAERRRQQAAKEETRFFGAERGRWLPPAVSDTLGEWALAPHLPGEVAGDCGFDPLGLCCEKEEKGSKGPPSTKAKRKAAGRQQQQQQNLLDRELFDRFFELELLHSRWAMLGALGAVVPEGLSLLNLASFPEDRWQFVGRARLEGTDLNYLGVPGLVVAGKQGERWRGGGEREEMGQFLFCVAFFFGGGGGRKLTCSSPLSSPGLKIFFVFFFKSLSNRCRNHRRVPGEDFAARKRRKGQRRNSGTKKKKLTLSRPRKIPPNKTNKQKTQSTAPAHVRPGARPLDGYRRPRAPGNLLERPGQELPGRPRLRSFGSCAEGRRRRRRRRGRGREGRAEIEGRRD